MAEHGEAAAGAATGAAAGGAAARGRGRPGRRRVLSEAEILDAALGLLGEKGAEAVSVRGIAAAVGVAPNAVYTYFPDRAALVGALVERILGELDRAAFADPGRPWRYRVHAVAAQLRERLMARPGAVDLLLFGPMDGPNALALGETLLEILAEAGLTTEDAARASYLLIVQVLGFVALEAAEVDRAAPVPSEAERVAARAAALRAVPAEAYPRTAASAGTVARYVTGEQFRWGLDRVLDGLVAGRSVK
ncbi:TetR/AcrR family transcriptional regulator [Kitasatospora sp. NPDC048365]|uniref:TetR/AcrR family transcriptional regulator n=1 Tax=Kitasatospora sp. NPDC048365 TaxID=3364050 RepID=UPI003719039B